MMNVLADTALPLINAFGSYAAAPNYQADYNNYADVLSHLADNTAPYVSQGLQAENNLRNMANYNMTHPAQIENNLALSYQESPYQQQMRQNLTRMMNDNAATTGMLGSTSANAALQNALAGQQNLWENQYMDRGLNQYQTALQELQNLAIAQSNRGWQAFQDQEQGKNAAAAARFSGSVAQTPVQHGLIGGLTGLAEDIAAPVTNLLSSIF